MLSCSTKRLTSPTEEASDSSSDQSGFESLVSYASRTTGQPPFALG